MKTEETHKQKMEAALNRVQEALALRMAEYVEDRSPDGFEIWDTTQAQELEWGVYLIDVVEALKRGENSLLTSQRIE